VANEQALEAGHMIQVHMGHEQRLRPFAVVFEERGQAFAAAVDGQPSAPAVALPTPWKRSRQSISETP